MLGRPRSRLRGTIAVSSLLRQEPPPTRRLRPHLRTLMDFCGSDTLASAEAEAGKLGSRRMTVAELKGWRAGGAVEVSGGGETRQRAAMPCRIGLRAAPINTVLLLRGDPSGAAFGRTLGALRAAPKFRQTGFRSNGFLKTRRDRNFLFASRAECRSLSVVHTD